jgi:hypothetical protein
LSGVSIIAGDNIVRLSGDGTFNNPVICRVCGDDLHGLSGLDRLGEVANPVFRQRQRFIRPAEFVPQDPHNLTQDVIGDVKLDVARARHIKQLVGRATEIQRRYIDSADI